jgi:hypothetical protein
MPNLSSLLGVNTHLAAVEFTADGSFEVPAGVSRIFAAVIGAGGGGASGRSTDGSYMGGGAGGGYAHGLFDVSEGDTLTVVVGAGGDRGSRAAGSDGGDSSITGTGVSISASGGAGGLIDGTAAAGGTGTGGDVQYTGGDGGDGTGLLCGTGGGAPGTYFGDGGNGGDLTAAASASGGGAAFTDAAADSEVGADPVASITTEPVVLFPGQLGIYPTNLSDGSGTHNTYGTAGDGKTDGTNGEAGGNFAGGGGAYAAASTENGGNGGLGAGGGGSARGDTSGSPNGGYGGDGYVVIVYQLPGTNFNV